MARNETPFGTVTMTAAVEDRNSGQEQSGEPNLEERPDSQSMKFAAISVP